MKIFKVLSIILSIIISTSFFTACNSSAKDNFQGLYDNIHDYNKDLADEKTGIVADFESEEEIHSRVSYLTSYSLNPKISLSSDKKFIHTGNKSVHIQSKFPYEFQNIWDAPKIFIEIPKVERNLRNVEKLSIYIFNDSEKDLTFALDLMTPDFTINANTDYMTLKAKSEMEASFDITDKLYYMKTNNYGFSLDNCCYFGIVVVGLPELKNEDLSLYIDSFKLLKGEEVDPSRRDVEFEGGEINNFNEDGKKDYVVCKRQYHLSYLSGIKFDLVKDKNIKGKSAKLNIKKDKIRASDSFPAFEFAGDGMPIKNFSKYKYLEFYVYNESDRKIEFEIEIHSYTDKFDYDFWMIEPNKWNHIIIPIYSNEDVPPMVDGENRIVSSKGPMVDWKDMNINIVKEIRFITFSDSMFKEKDSDINLYLDEIYLRK